MKALKVTILALAMIGMASVSRADVCISTDPDFDEITCLDLGGTVGIPIGNSGNPGGPSGVPIDGGASFLLAAGIGAAVKRFRNNKKA